MNKNISIWRGNTAPPTSNHLWLKDGKLYHYDGTSWKENEVDLSTEENDGLMSKEDKHRLDNLVYNGLDSNDTDKALSAKQGKILSDRLEELNLSAYLIRGSVETLDDIPYDNLLSGDVYNILKPFYIDGKRYPEGTNVVWTGTKLDPLGGVVDFKDYSTTSLVQNMIAFLDALLKAHLVSYTTSTFMKDNSVAGTFKCKHLKITNAYIGSLKLYSITIKVASDQSLSNLDKTYLYVNNSLGTTVSLNSISLTINKGRYITWFFDGSKILDSGGQLTLSLHTTNVISEANDNNLVPFIICGLNIDPTDIFICNDDGSLNRNITPELAINYVDISSIYSHILDIKKHTMSYATSELSDLTTPSHRVNIKKIRINLSVMGISLINSVSIMVADDNAYDGLIHLNIYDTNSLLTVVSKNVINLSDNLGKYVTWYFTPFKLTENVNYEFFADNEQLMRIHLSENKNEGVVCIDQYSYTREDFTPALGINIEPIVTDEIYSKAENIYADVLNNKSEINRIDNEVINFLYDVDEVRLNLSTTNAELDKTKQELTNTKQELSELQAKIQDHEDRIWKLENQWYGIEWDTEVSSPAVTRIGNMDLHRTLPIQSRMRGCLLDDNGKVTKYLNPKDWTGEVRDGSRGQVMVEIPMHYRRCETEGTKRRVKLSEYPLPGFLPIPRMYPSAYEASLQRSTNKLCSVVNTDPDFRGGTNQSEWDGTYRSLLGRPVTNINRTNFRTYARNRNNAATAEWNIYTYHLHKAIYWLYVVEYANRNSQLPFTAELTVEGFRQGGLGEGVSNWINSEWNTFNYVNSFVPCGHTDTLGNATGVLAYTAYNADGSELKTSNVPRYRGIENPFGHIFKWTDGINLRISPTEANGGDNLSKVFVCEVPYLYNDTNYKGYKHVGNESRSNGYVKDIIFGEDGEIIPSLVGGGSTQFFCDFINTFIPTKEKLCGVIFSGKADYNVINGLAYSHSSYDPSILDYTIGTRLCFLPAE